MHITNTKKCPGLEVLPAFLRFLEKAIWRIPREYRPLFVKAGAVRQFLNQGILFKRNFRQFFSKTPADRFPPGTPNNKILKNKAETIVMKQKNPGTFLFVPELRFIMDHNGENHVSVRTRIRTVPACAGSGR